MAIAAIWAKSIDFGMPEAQWDGSDRLTITKMTNCRLPIRVNILFWTGSFFHELHHVIP